METRRVVSSVSLGLLPEIVSLGFDALPLTGAGIEAHGLAVSAYCFLRLLLALVLLMSFFSAGALIRRFLFRASEQQTGSTRVILNLGTGAAGIALVVLLFGFAGLLYRGLAWALLTSLLAAIPFLFELRASRPSIEWRSASPLLLALNGLTAGFLLVYRAWFPSEIDGDVWEHYLHYFYEVTQVTHSLWPGELWIHFFTSKGATIQILASLLSDVLAPQIVSWCFVVLTALVAYDLTRTFSRSAQWGLVSSLAVFEAAMIFNATPNFMKHHMVFGGFVAFVCWCTVRCALLPAPANAFRAPAMLAAFYTALYLPVGGGILIGGLVGAALAAALFRCGTTTTRDLGAITLCAAMGVAVILGLNYGITGLALDAPLGVFWRHVDLERFRHFWDPLVLEYWFIGIGAVESAPPTLSTIVVPKASWLYEVLRLIYLGPLVRVLILAAVVGGAYGLWKRQPPRWDSARPAVVGLALIATFLVGSLALANVFPGSDSVYRLYAFCFALVLVCVTGLIAVLSRPSLHDRLGGSLLPLVTALLVSWPLLGAAKIQKDRLTAVLAYATGKTSMRDVLTLNDHYSGLPGGFSDFLNARRAVSGQRILYMGYSPSPGYLLPTPPLLSEPSYSFGTHYGEIVYGDAQTSEVLLRQLDVNYFLINMRSRLFLGIPYSPLFDASAISRRLGLRWSNGEFYLLTWRGNDAKPLPPEFVAMLEIKQRSLFARLRADLPELIDRKPTSYRSALAALQRYANTRLRTPEARRFIANFVVAESKRAPRKLGEALLEYAKAAWGEQIATDIWNLRLSEDIQSQDFGWLYERNRVRYLPRQGDRNN